MLPLSVSSTSDFTSELNWTELIRACKCYLCRWALLPILQLNWTELNRVCKCYRFCCVGTTVGFVSDRTITVFLNWTELNWTALEPLTDCRVCKWRTPSAFFCCAVTTEEGTLSLQIYNWTELNKACKYERFWLNWIAWEQLTDCMVVSGKKIIGVPAAREQL